MEHLKYTEILRQNRLLAAQAGGKHYQIGILSNITLNLLKDILEYSCRINGIHPLIETGNYNNIVQDSEKFCDKDLVIIFYDMINVLQDESLLFECLTDEEYARLLEKVFREIDIIFGNLKRTASVIFNTFSAACFETDHFGGSVADRFAREVNAYLAAKKGKNVWLLRMDEIFMKTGVGNATDRRFYHSSKAPYTLAFFKQYVSAIEGLLLKNTGKQKKVLLFDCDNTLWEGIIGEDGHQKIEQSFSERRGRFYLQVQKIAARLSKKGILIGLCSKNNEDDVMEVLRNQSQMALKEEHLVTRKINWQDKASNIKAIARELNLGTDSIVFVDDSPFEINLIREQLPEVTTVQVPEAIEDYPALLMRTVYRHFNLSPTDDDLKRTEMYKAELERKSAVSAHTSIEDYLSSLNIELCISVNRSEDIGRASQLTLKTNQFNLTTKRYTETQIGQFMTSPGNFVFTLDVKDKYGPYGLTGVAIVTVKEGKALIDTFLLSCRIIGRNIEYAFINQIVSFLKDQGIKSIAAGYVPSSKNMLVEHFYLNAGFRLQSRSEDGTGDFDLDAGDFTPRNIPYILLTNNLQTTWKLKRA